MLLSTIKTTVFFSRFWTSGSFLIETSLWKSIKLKTIDLFLFLKANVNAHKEAYEQNTEILFLKNEHAIITLHIQDNNENSIELHNCIGERIKPRLTLSDKGYLQVLFNHLPPYIYRLSYYDGQQLKVYWIAVK